MKNISHLHAKKFVFPKTVRKYYKVCGLLTSVGLLGFSLLMLGAGLKQHTNKWPCFLLSIFWGGLYIVYLVTWIRNYYIINAAYYVDDCIACNYINRKNFTISVSLDSAIHSGFRYSFNFGYASSDEHYIIISSKVLSDKITSNIEVRSIYKTVKRIWESGSVIVPKSNY